MTKEEYASQIDGAILPGLDNNITTVFRKENETLDEFWERVKQLAKEDKPFTNETFVNTKTVRTIIAEEDFV